MKKNERIPALRVPSLVQIAKHGDNVRAGAVLRSTKGGAQKVYKRRKEICPLCKSVTHYLTTHLTRSHNLKKEDSRYHAALKEARLYRGRTQEMRLDANVYKKSRKIPRELSDKSEESDVEPQPSTSKKNIGLEVLMKGMPLIEDESDEEFHLSESSDEDIVKPTPTKTRSVIQTRKSGSQNVELQEESEHEEDGVWSDFQEDAEGGNYEEEGGSDDDEEEEEEDDDEVDNFDTLKAYYTEGNPKTIREKLLKLFYDYLSNILGGCKKERQAILHSQHIRTVSAHLDPKNKSESLEWLVKNGGMDVWKEWAKPLLQNNTKRPGTIKAYFASLTKFCKFIVDHHEHKMDGFPALSEDLVRKVDKLISRFKGFASSVTRLYKHRFWEKQMEDEENAVDPKLAANIMSLTPAKEAIQYLQLSFGEGESTESEFITLRDFLIVRLALENCQRPGPLENATLVDFRRAKKVDVFTVMKVAKHKTTQQGPANITISNNLETNIKAYVGNIRPLFAAKDEDALFVTRDGGRFPQGSIGKRVIE